MNLEFYSLKYKEYIDDYRMSKLQLGFSSHPKKIIADNKYDYYILGFADGNMTNFLALKEKQARDEIAIKGFSTDENSLRSGYGLLFLRSLSEFIKNNMNEIKRISLEVNIENKGAIDLYRKGDYIETDIVREGRKGRLQYMYLDIK